MSDGSMSQQEIDRILSMVDPPVGTKGLKLDATIKPFSNSQVLTRVGKKLRDEKANSCPPLGVKPRWLHEEDRLRELHEAMMRHKDAGEPIPRDWITEYNDLMLRAPEPRRETAG